MRQINKRKRTKFNYKGMYGGLHIHERVKEPTYMRGSETEMENEEYDMLSFRRPLQKDKSRCSVINYLLTDIGQKK